MSERFSLFLTRGAEKEWGAQGVQKDVSDGKDDDGL